MAAGEGGGGGGGCNKRPVSEGAGVYTCAPRVREWKMGSPAVSSRHVLTGTPHVVACLWVSSICLF